KTNENSRSMGVGLTPCSLPQTGEPRFEIGENEMEIGLGHHGEPGIRKAPLESADHVADQLLEPIFNDMPLNEEEEVTVIVNGFGFTSRMELYIFFRRVEKVLIEKGIKIYRTYVDDYITSLEMGGCSITLTKLDDELKKLVDKP